MSRGEVRSRSRWHAWRVAMLCAIAASGCKPTCAENSDAIAACGWVSDHSVCSTASDRCYTACEARASCDELDAAFGDNHAPPWLRLCWAGCAPTFTCPDGTVIRDYWRCDGEEDCVGGGDERDCDYFECADATLVAAERQCDEWPDCDDRSDEKDCGYFLCGDNSMTLPDDERCNGEEQCEDGSDERECP